MRLRVLAEVSSQTEPTGKDGILLLILPKNSAKRNIEIFSQFPVKKQKKPHNRYIKHCRSDTQQINEAGAETNISYQLARAAVVVRVLFVNSTIG